MNDENKNALKKAMTLRKILLGILIAIIILFPTTLAIMNVAYTDSGRSARSERASQVVMFTSDGEELYRESSSEGLTGDTSLISIFNTIYNNMSSSDKISDNVVTAEPIVVEITGKDGTVTLTCYFSFTEGASFCIDESGNYHKIRNEDSERFWLSPFAETLYRDSTPPTLNSADGDMILPTGASWHYQNIDGIFTASEKLKLYDGSAVYDMAGGISFEFSTAPDSCSVEIYDGNVMVFSGVPDQLDQLILRSDSVVDVLIRAEWERRGDRTYYGSVEYSFGVAVRNRAEFFISSSKVLRDEFIVVHATNIKDVSKLNFISDTVSVSPEFLLTGEDVYAIIPCAAVPQSSESFDFTVTYGVSSATFSVDVTGNTAISQSSLKNTANILGISPENIPNQNAEYLFLSGITVPPDTSLFNTVTEYGDTVEYGSNSIYSCFTEYECTFGHGMPVSAVGGGKVVYVGQNGTIGNYVVVDMGLGLRVWYCNLSASDVYVGKYVAAGDMIGKTGTLLDGKREGFTLMLSFGDVILNTTSLFQKEFGI